MKKAFLLTAALILAAGMVFAAGGGQAAGGVGTTTISFWHIQTGDNRRIPIENATKRFEQQNPGVKIEIETYTNDAYKTKLKTVTGNDFPNVFHSWAGGWLKDFVDAGLVADITQEVQSIAPLIGQNNLNFANYGGKIYGIPYAGTSTVLYYNKDLFTKYNLQFPKTYAELENVAKVFIANGVSPFTVANRSRWPGAQYFVLLSMRIGGPDVFQRAMDKKIKFTDDAFIRAGDMLLDQIKNGWFPAGVNGLNSDQGQDRMMFYQEQAAMMIMTSGTIASIQNENRDFFDKKLGIALYPSIAGTPGKSTDLLAGGNVISVASNANKAIAAKFLNFICSEEQLQQELLGTGSIPIRQGLKTTNHIVQELLSQVASASYLQNYIDQTLTTELSQRHLDTVQALFGQTMTSRQAADEMQKAYDSAK